MKIALHLGNEGSARIAHLHCGPHLAAAPCEDFSLEMIRAGLLTTAKKVLEDRIVMMAEARWAKAK